MWLRVALDNNSMHYNNPVHFSYIEGDSVEEYYFDQAVADALEEDGFLVEMWANLDALFDWGDCDFFPPDKCTSLRSWITKRLSAEVSPMLEPVYQTMLDFCNKAIDNQTGISFDF